MWIRKRSWKMSISSFIYNEQCQCQCQWKVQHKIDACETNENESSFNLWIFRIQFVEWNCFSAKSHSQLGSGHIHIACHQSKYKYSLKYVLEQCVCLHLCDVRVWCLCLCAEREDCDLHHLVYESFRDGKLSVPSWFNLKISLATMNFEWVELGEKHTKWTWY